MSDVIYQDKGYQLTAAEFTYKGNKEPIDKVSRLYLIENDTKRKVINGSIGALIVLFITLLFYPILGMFFVLAEPNPIAGLIYKWGIPVLMGALGFMFNFLKTKNYALEIEKSTGNKGIIDYSNSKEQFEQLIKVFHETRYNFKE
ncbi:hypothetical protein [Motilimonas eburnea]|uniref:hypothetical protein n=1 Tax=Motilimonas eburnea TaxID=1737488 RepID=UPI001E627CF8|nr:hypothetical protein [Motilimonas eburnea]MCE2573777.1 hypothetical protein [Motilimonas eburnea]